MPTFDDVRAQPAAVRTLRAAVQRDRVASAYLFEGPDGVGKQRASLALASALLCPQSPGRGCGTCETCRRITSGNHPDVRTFLPREDGDRNLKVERIREEILPFSHFAPFEARAAVAIFPEADVSFPAHHAEAANALLKTLEEPRPRVHFVLLAARPDQLLQTIRSRCQRVRFQRLPDRTLQQILEEANVPEAEREAASALADGRADLALRFAVDGAGKRLVELALRVDQAVEEARSGLLLELGDELAKHDDRALVLDTLATFYRDVAAAAAGLDDGALRLRRDAARIRERATQLGAARAAARAEALRHAQRDLDANASAQLVIESLLLTLRSTA
jgi:DNA polymerase-3 subunit delta'